MTSSVGTYRVRQRPIASGRALPAPLPEFVQNYIRNGEAASTAPFTGITTDGTLVPGLFPLQATGMPTEPIRQAAESFLSVLSPEQRERATFAVESDAWRRWSNIHVFTLRHGVSLDELGDRQREQALSLLRVSLSATGYDSARDIMK